MSTERRPKHTIERATLKEWVQPCASADQIATELVPAAFLPVPLPDWPWWARILRWSATDADVGVGDTIHRLLGEIGESFVQTMKALGVPCACDRRRAEFNANYSYQRGVTDNQANRRYVAG